MTVRRPTLRLGGQLRAKVGQHADHAVRVLAAAWTKAWDQLSADMEAAVLEVVALAAQLGHWPEPWRLTRVHRLTMALLAAQQALIDLGAHAGVTIVDAAGATIRDVADAEPNLIASQLPAGMRADAATRFAARITPAALGVIVDRTSQQIVSTLRPLSQEATEAMHRELIRGVALGDNPRASARAMLRGLESGFNGGLARAANIARTEILDAYRVTSAHAHRANADVLDGWVWLCHLGPRTCPACLALNGSVHPLDEPGPLDHQSGRCARMPLVKPWKTLGVNLPEPDHAIPDARAWFARQPPAVQRQIMGARRLKLLDGARIGWDDIPQRRTTPAWRDSFTPRSAAALERLAAKRDTPLPRRRQPVSTAGTRPTVVDLLNHPNLDDAAKIVNGVFAGLTTRVQSATLEDGHAYMTGEILNAAGENVGQFARVLSRDDNGLLVAHHGLLDIIDSVQAQGFAEAFNAHLIAWYRESGVDRVQLHANITVGGYAWARAGFDFADADDAQHVLTRLASQVRQHDADARALRTVVADDGQNSRAARLLARVEDQLTAARAILQAAEDHEFGTLGFPSAYEISQAGRWPGAGRDDRWIGKAAMLGSGWDGVMPL